MLGLPLIRNVKHLDPADPTTPEVIQIETAMGAAIEVFEGARTIEVGRDRFVPVKTTNDLLVLRSDIYDLGRDFVLDQASRGRARSSIWTASSTSWSATSTSGSRRAPRRCARPRRSSSTATSPSAPACASWATSTIKAPSAQRIDARPCWLPMAELLPVPDLVERILASVSPLPDFPQPLMEALGLAARRGRLGDHLAAGLRQLRHGRLRRVVRRCRVPPPRTAPCTCRWSGRSAPAGPA